MRCMLTFLQSSLGYAMRQSLTDRLSSTLKLTEQPKPLQLNDNLEALFQSESYLYILMRNNVLPLIQTKFKVKLT